MAISYLNGTWQAIEDAKISVLDRGFMFGDGIYEVIPVYDGRVFTLDQHLTRLGKSLAEIKLANPLGQDEWAALIKEALVRAEEITALVYIQVTRGIAAKRDHVYPKGPATVLLTVSAAPILDRKSIKPYALVSLEDFRWGRGHIKTVSLIAAGMLKNEAISQGADDAVLIRDGLATEGTSSNIFMVKDGVIVTPPKSKLLLHGITRDLVVELAAANGLALQERDIPATELAGADELMITGSGHEVWPVVQLDGQPVGNGAPGVMWKTLDNLFQSYKKQVLQLPA
ncbi:MAG: D-alanine transaminase [Candidatus Azotimanducaceae bacterium]|jgi:D-alanine transaminase